MTNPELPQPLLVSIITVTLNTGKALAETSDPQEMTESRKIQHSN